MNDLIFECRAITKRYHDGNDSILVLKKINFSLAQGERVAIVGPSGSGKSTFLHLLGGLDYPNEGEIFVMGKNWQALSEQQRCQLRNHSLGFIYQFHHLLPEFTALENVAIPLLLAKNAPTVALNKAAALLEQVGLKQRCFHKPSALSGGERQRVAIARALINSPHCILADEPTGNLDQTTALNVFDLFLKLNQCNNTALIVVTHDMDLAKKMDRIITINAAQFH